ncbi:flagellar biosynthetic protein FliO [Acerihabitans arboris]|uniref:Flagellar protein n=1 Tax=Acerihabitans arboris TaxID=2691583 RepID=A0A845SFF7_9GAMM|nr:flagellar biosynthetic protein FliO [Acerihabitans arboris]NDL62609.1 flagellar biosynthetic protein FliO [Acerihabitans arboris]
MTAAQPLTATHAAPAAGPGFNASGALTQMAGALAAILLVIVVGAWLVRKLGLAPGAGRSQRLKMLASCSVGQRERVVVVEVEGTWLVLGVTAQHITPLHSLPAPPEAPDSVAGAPDFRQRLRQVMNRTGNGR